MGLFRYLGRLICKAAFRLTDDNKNGKLESIEIEIAVLRLYHIINKRLPGWQDPPSRAAIIAALKQFDANHDGSLDLDEFELFARSFIKSGPDVFFSRIGKNVVVETGLVPASAMVIKHVARGSALFGGLAQDAAHELDESVKRQGVKAVCLKNPQQGVKAALFQKPLKSDATLGGPSVVLVDRPARRLTWPKGLWLRPLIRIRKGYKALPLAF